MVIVNFENIMDLYKLWIVTGEAWNFTEPEHFSDFCYVVRA